MEVSTCRMILVRVGNSRSSRANSSATGRSGRATTRIRASASFWSRRTGNAASWNRIVFTEGSSRFPIAGSEIRQGLARPDLPDSWKRGLQRVAVERALFLGFPQSSPTPKKQQQELGLACLPVIVLRFLKQHI